MKNKLIVKGLLSVTAFLSAILVFGQSKWTWENPQENGNSLNDVAIISNDLLYLAGNKGTFIKSDSKGKISGQSRIPTVNDITKIHFSNALNGWAVTSNGEIFFSGDSGKTWKIQYSDDSNPTLTNLHFWDEQSGYAAGHNGYSENVIIRTTDGGKSWTKVKLPERQEGFSWKGIFQIQALSSGKVVAVAYDKVIYRSNNNGTTWDTSHVSIAPEADYYEGAWFNPDSTGWMVGPEFYIVKTTDLGKTWIKQSGSKDSTDEKIHYLTFARFLNKNEGWVAGFNCFYVTSDGGSTWQMKSEGIPEGRKTFITFLDKNRAAMGYGLDVFLTEDESLKTIKILPAGITNTLKEITKNNDSYWITGGQGTILKSEDGKKWTSINTGTSIDLNTIDSHQNVIWTAGADGKILFSENNGETWKLIENTTNSKTITSLKTPAHNILIAAGLDNTLIRSTDNGNTWSKPAIDAIGDLNKLFFINGSTGWVAGDKGFIGKTIDAGQTWSIQNSGILTNIYDIRFTDDQYGWAVGASGNIIHTNDGGKTWLPQISKITTSINSIYMLDRNIGYVAGSYGVTLKTTDGGQTWVELADNPSANSINSIYFEKTGKGIFIGGYGNILTYNENPVNKINEERKPETVIIFPNPAQSNISFQGLSDSEKNASVTILNSTGKLVYKTEIRTDKAEIILPESLDNGIYYYQLQTDNLNTTGKLSILR